MVKDYLRICLDNNITSEEKHAVMNALFGRVHQLLSQPGSRLKLAVAYPNIELGGFKPTLGTVMDIFADTTALEQVKSDKAMRILVATYCDEAKIAKVPSGINSYRAYTRVRGKVSLGRIRRHAIRAWKREHPDEPLPASDYFEKIVRVEDDQTVHTIMKHPFVHINSTSTAAKGEHNGEGSLFPLFISFNQTTNAPDNNDFNSYGLSKGGYVPHIE